MSRRHSPNDKSQNPCDEQRYCICQKTEDELDDQDFMIECDGCNGWFHGKCIGLADRIADDIEKYFCDECAKQHGPSIFKQRRNQHRRDFSDANADNKPTQSGTQDFINKLKRKIFPSCEAVITRLKGNQVTEEYLRQNGFTKPILVTNRDGLELTLPNRNITLAEINNLVGPDRFIDIIDCEKQVTYKMSLEDYIEYFESFERNKIYNVLSLEVSNTKLGEQITLPRIVRDLSWASTGIWPTKNTDDDQRKKQENWPTQNRRRTASSTDTDASDDEIDANHFENFQRPEVTKYCLMSPQASYTDFHVDFGGSSVWYSVVRGEKIFYVIEPTDENLQKYADWSRSPTESETFLGDCVSHCYKMHLKEDNTVFIPAGWIHAVYTVTDSLVFGGNFLQSMSVDMQLRIYELERLAQVPNKFQFPLFETFHWYAAKAFYDEIKKANEYGSGINPITQQACESMLHYMSKWLANDKRYQTKNRLIIPKGIQCDKLMRDLGRELDTAKSRGGSSFHSKPPSLSIITSPMKIESKHELVQINHTKIKVKCRRLSSTDNESTKMKGNEMKLTIKTKLTGCRKPNQNQDLPPIINKKKVNRINPPIKQEESPKMTYTLDLESKRQRFIEPSTSYSSSHEPLESTDDTSTNDSSIPEDIHETNEIFESMADGGLASFVKSSSDADHSNSPMKREHSLSEKKNLTKKIKIKTKETDKLNKIPKKIKNESIESSSKTVPLSTTPKSSSSTSLPKKRPSSSTTPKKSSNSKDPLGKILKIANSIKSRGGILT